VVVVVLVDVALVDVATSRLPGFCGWEGVVDVDDALDPHPLAIAMVARRARGIAILLALLVPTFSFNMADYCTDNKASALLERSVDAISGGAI
jgi:hypothetical protein